MFATWITTAGDAIVVAATLMGGAIALVGLGAALSSWYRRTLGRRANRYGRLARLGTGAQLSFFQSVLGEPPAMRFARVMQEYVEVVGDDDPRFDPRHADELGFHEVRGPWPYTECYFIDRDYYVQTICDMDETVVAFSVTTRRKGFSPIFEWPPQPGWRTRRKFKKDYGADFPIDFRIRLGKTRLATLRDPPPMPGPIVKFALFARGFAYSELHYGANPGGYQTFVFTASSTAGPAVTGNVATVNGEIGVSTDAAGEWPPAGTDLTDGLPELPPGLRRFRDETAITTYTVIGKDLSFTGNYPATFGPQGDEVRTLP